MSGRPGTAYHSGVDMTVDTTVEARITERTRERRCSWCGELTWRRTAELREAVFDLLEQPGLRRLVLDVTGVEVIDRTGVALLVGCHHRAAAMSRTLVLVDGGGTVSDALSGAGVISAFAFDAPPAIRAGRRPVA